MANRTGKKLGLTADQVVSAWKRNGYSQRAAARELGCDAANVIRRLRKLADAGDERVSYEKLYKGKNEAGGFTLKEVNRALVELGHRREAKLDKGDWRRVNVIKRVRTPCFVLGLFGDPHMDNPGTDLDLFQEEVQRLDPAQNVYGINIGDIFDNWVRALAHAGQGSTDPYAAWMVFTWLMEHNPFLSIILGNHDIWNTGTANVLHEFCRTNGIIARRSGGRFAFDTGHGEPLTVSARHIWRGNSMYSAAHSLIRAARDGMTDDDIVTGGHIHQGEVREYVRPHDGRVQKLAQLGSFKRLDDYANDRGFMSAEMPPVVWCACDTREPKTSHERVQMFYDFDTARDVAARRSERNS